jgi:nucleoside-diphosphate-sugar epimerase
MASVIILGAKGRFGRAAVEAFVAGGWRVTALARSWSGDSTDTPRVTVDVTDHAALTQACMGQDVIVNAVNPPYPAWSVQIPKITAAVLAAARASGATVMIPGNVYNYGHPMPPVVTEQSPWAAKTRKGGIRIRMENTFRDSDVATIVLRGGDFLEPARTGNWFDTHIAAKAWQGKMTYPGPRDIDHAWAYLPDMARALVGLAERRSSFARFEEFGFGGFTLTGDALIGAVEAATGRKMRVSRMPWPILRIMGLFSAQIREVLEMRYLWTVAHGIDDAKLRAALPGFRQTPLPDAIAACLAPHAPLAKQQRSPPLVI